MRHIAPLATIATVGLSALLAIAAQRFDEVKIRTTRITDGHYMLEGAGGNIGVSAGTDGLLIVDTQFRPLAPKIRAALAEISEAPIRFVLNTHVHGDHVGGNPELGRGVPIIAHDNVRRRLQGDAEYPRDALPVITYASGVSIHFNGEEIRVIHLGPGHTDGDSVVFFGGSNVVHMGDHFFAGRFPYIDLDSGGDVRSFMKNVERLIGMIDDETKIIPGHGPLSTRSDFRTFLGMLEETVGHIEAGIEKGKSLEDLHAEGLPDRWDSWGTGFIPTNRWIDIVYRSLTR